MAEETGSIREAPGVAVSVSGWRDLLGYKNSNSVYVAIKGGLIPKASVKNATTGAPSWGFPEFLVTVYRNKRFEQRFRGPGKDKCTETGNEHLCETWETAALVLDAFHADPRFYAEYAKSAQSVMAQMRSASELRRQAQRVIDAAAAE